METLNVFGGRGFVGSNYCLNMEHMLIINDRNDYTVKSNNILYFLSTVSNYNVLKDPYVDIDTNLTTLMKVLEQCKDNGTTFNFVSSWFVYGDTDLPAREESPCNPKGFYSITKRAAEQLLISYAETFNINYRIFRLANVVGGVLDKKASVQKNALQHLLNEIKDGRDINLYDGGRIIRDYIHNNDVQFALDLLLDKGEINTIYNVGNGQPIVFFDILDTARKITGSSSKFNEIEIPRFHKIVQVKNMWMKNTKLKKLGYHPEYNFDEDLERTVENLLNG